jgi:hypothetical protein
VIHQSMNDERREISFFSERRNDMRGAPPQMYWPTHDEWVESGRGDLWKTEKSNIPGMED